MVCSGSELPWSFDSSWKTLSTKPLEETFGDGRRVFPSPQVPHRFLTAGTDLSPWGTPPGDEFDAPLLRLPLGPLQRLTDGPVVFADALPPFGDSPPPFKPLPQGSPLRLRCSSSLGEDPVFISPRHVSVGNALGVPRPPEFCSLPAFTPPRRALRMLPGRDTASTGNRPLPERRFAVLPCGEPHLPLSPSRALSGPLGVAPLMAFVSPDGQIRTATSAGLCWASSIRSLPVSRRRFGLIHLQGVHLRASPVPPTGGINSWRGPFLSWASLSPPVRASIAGEGTGPSGPRRCSSRRNSGKTASRKVQGQGPVPSLLRGGSANPGTSGLETGVVRNHARPQGHSVSPCCQ